MLYGCPSCGATDEESELYEYSVGNGYYCNCCGYEGMQVAGEKSTCKTHVISEDCLSLHEIKKHIKKLSDGKLLEALEYVQDIRKQRIKS